MAEGLYIDFSGFKDFNDKLKNMPAELTQKVDEVLSRNVDIIATKAKENAPVNFGGLHSSISANNSEPLKKHINVNAPYAAYIEFGTGVYAAQQVAKLPPDWQTFAAQFKGKTGGGIDKLFENILKWVKAKGLHGLTASGNRRTGKKADEDIYNIAYVITINILRNGIHAHPYLYPAYEGQRQQIIKDVETVLKSL